MARKRTSAEDTAIENYQQAKIEKARNAPKPQPGIGVTRKQAERTLGRLSKSPFRLTTHKPK